MFITKKYILDDIIMLLLRFPFLFKDNWMDLYSLIHMDEGEFCVVFLRWRNMLLVYVLQMIIELVYAFIHNAWLMMYPRV